MAKKVSKKTAKKPAKTSKKARKSAPKSSAKKTISKAAPKAAAPKKAKASDVVYKLKVGDRVPSFSGAATSGRTLNEETHDSKALVLYFYPKDNTPGCTLEGQDFRKLYKEFQAAGADIVGVSQDSVQSHEKFKSKCDFPFELLSDDGGAICKAFDVMQMKSMYGRDFVGIERSTFLIRDGVIKKEWRKVKVTGHAQEVLDAVKAL